MTDKQKNDRHRVTNKENNIDKKNDREKDR